MIQRPDQPDFQRFVTAIRGGCPDRVPVAEALVDNGATAGYDLVSLSIAILDPAKFRQALKAAV